MCTSHSISSVFLSPCIWSLLKPVIGHHTSGRHRSGSRPVSRHLINHAVSLPSILCSGAAWREHVQPVHKQNGSRNSSPGHLEWNGHYKKIKKHTTPFLSVSAARRMIDQYDYPSHLQKMTSLIYMESDLWGLCCPENTDGVPCTRLFWANPNGYNNDCWNYWGRSSWPVIHLWARAKDLSKWVEGMPASFNTEL